MEVEAPNIVLEIKINGNDVEILTNVDRYTLIGILEALKHQLINETDAAYEKATSDKSETKNASKENKPNVKQAIEGKPIYGDPNLFKVEKEISGQICDVMKKIESIIK